MFENKNIRNGLLIHLPDEIIIKYKNIDLEDWIYDNFELILKNKNRLLRNYKIHEGFYKLKNKIFDNVDISQIDNIMISLIKNNKFDLIKYVINKYNISINDIYIYSSKNNEITIYFIELKPEFIFNSKYHLEELFSSKNTELLEYLIDYNLIKEEINVCDNTDYIQHCDKIYAKCEKGCVHNILNYENNNLVLYFSVKYNNMIIFQKLINNAFYNFNYNDEQKNHIFKMSVKTNNEYFVRFFINNGLFDISKFESLIYYSELNGYENIRKLLKNKFDEILIGIYPLP